MPERSILSNGLSIRVNANSVNHNKVYATLNVENLTDTVAKYTNESLLLIFDKKQSRAYVNLVASQVVDFSDVEIEPKEKKQYQIYFAFSEDVIPSDTSKMTLIYSTKTTK